MSDEIMLEVAVDTTDEELLLQVERAMADASPRRWPATRDIGTIITIASDLTGLINALLALRAVFDKKSSTSPISIIIRNENRDEVRLADISEQSARELAAESSPETA